MISRIEFLLISSVLLSGCKEDAPNNQPPSGRILHPHTKQPQGGRFSEEIRAGGNLAVIFFK